LTNIGFTGKEITKKLSPNIIENGGLQIVTMPIAKVSNEVDKVEYGGYQSLVHYNKDRETQHNKDKWNKSMRKLRRNLRNKGLRQRGETVQTGVTGDSNS
jgi:hypothetical protein